MVMGKYNVCVFVLIHHCTESNLCSERRNLSKDCTSRNSINYDNNPTNLHANDNINIDMDTVQKNKRQAKNDFDSVFWTHFIFNFKFKIKYLNYEIYFALNYSLINIKILITHKLNSR